MSVLEQGSYRRAFGEYLRKGTPIRPNRKQNSSSDQYVWHTRSDEKVRPSHRANDGHIFSWDDPPDTGHPGTDYNCRCQAIPYVPGETEFAYHTMSDLSSSSLYRWTDLDFMAHYFYGSGVPVTLSEIGHLREIAEQYAYSDGDEGAFRRLSNQIAEEARNVRLGNLTYVFNDSYDFDPVQFSHGGGEVGGTFTGPAMINGDMLRIVGRSIFNFSDLFADPLDLGIEVGGDPFAISGVWSAEFAAEVLLDAEVSDFKGPKAE